MRNLLALGLAAAAAAGCASARQEDDFRLPRRFTGEPLTTLSGHVWRADATADLTVEGIDAETDGADREDVIGGRVEAYLDRVSFILDGFWVHVEGNAGGVEGDLRYGRFDLRAAMRIAGEDRLPLEERTKIVSPWVDGVAGVRAHVANLSADPSNFQIADDDVLWIEPFLGARVGVTLLRRITLEAQADFGGIGYQGFQSTSSSAEVGLRVDLVGGLGAFVSGRWARVRASDDSNDDGFDESFLEVELEGVMAGVLWEF